MKSLLFLGLMLFAAHYVIAGWIVDNSVGKCRNPRHQSDISLCECVKSRTRKSTALLELMFKDKQGNKNREQLEQIFRICYSIN